VSTDDLTPQQKALRTHLAKAFSHDPRPLAGDDECERPRCERPQAYAVPSHGGMGGDHRVCRYHTAAYRDEHPETWASILEVDPRAGWVADDCGLYTCWDDIPPTQQLGDAVCEVVAHCWTGIAIYEDSPGDEDDSVVYYSVARDEVRGRVELGADSESVYQFIDWVRTEHGLSDVAATWARVIPERLLSPITFHRQGGESA
jgi:hypothetical protein